MSVSLNQKAISNFSSRLTWIFLLVSKTHNLSPNPGHVESPMCLSQSLISAYTPTKKKTLLPSISSSLIAHALDAVWMPRLLRSLLIASGTQVCLWSSSSNCCGMAWGEEGCSCLTSGSAPWPHDWIQASMFDETDWVSTFIRDRVCHRACQAGTAILIGFGRLSCRHCINMLCVFVHSSKFSGGLEVVCRLIRWPLDYNRNRTALSFEFICFSSL